MRRRKLRRRMMAGVGLRIEDSVDLQKFDGLFIGRSIQRKGHGVALARRSGQMHNETFAHILNDPQNLSSCVSDPPLLGILW